MTSKKAKLINFGLKKSKLATLPLHVKCGDKIVNPTKQNGIIAEKFQKIAKTRHFLVLNMFKTNINT